MEKNKNIVEVGNQTINPTKQRNENIKLLLEALRGKDKDALCREIDERIEFMRNYIVSEVVNTIVVGINIDTDTQNTLSKIIRTEASIDALLEAKRQLN